MLPTSMLPKVSPALFIIGSLSVQTQEFDSVALKVYICRLLVSGGCHSHCEL